MCGLVRPGEDVDVGFGDFDTDGGFTGFGACVPDLDCAVVGGGGEDMLFCRGPLQLFDGAFVASEGGRVSDEASALGSGGCEDVSSDVAGQKLAFREHR
jgi:hypothetical protein